MRWLTLEDAELMLLIWNDPAFVRHVGDRGIRTMDQARAEISKGAMRLYRDYGFGPYRVSLKDDDTAIGICGIFRREGLDEPDIGFSMLPPFCNCGYAYESASAVINYARDDLNLSHLVAIVSPDNAASVGLIKKLGLRFETMLRLPGENHDVNRYGIGLAG